MLAHTVAAQATRPRDTLSSRCRGTDVRRVPVLERLDGKSIPRDAEGWKPGSTGDRHCLLELADVKFIDSTGVALLVRLQRQISACGRHLILLAPGAAVRRTLALMRLEDCFETAPDAVEARELIESRERERAMQVINGARRPLVWQG